MNNSQQTTHLCDIKYKIVFLGEICVGKSSIIERFTKGAIDDRYNSTVGIDFIAKNVNYKNSTYRLQLWDTAGQQRFRSLIPNYMRDAHCAVIVYDVTNKESLERSKIWAKMFSQHQKEGAIMLLVGTKIDLPSREVTFEQGRAKAQSDNISHCEVSSKTGQGIQEMFQQIIANIFIAKNNATPNGEDQFVLAGCNSSRLLDINGGQKGTQSTSTNSQHNQSHSQNSNSNGNQTKSQTQINKRTKIDFNKNKSNGLRRKDFACCYI